MNELKMAPLVRLRLEQIKQKKPHVLILHGVRGVGLGTIAKQVAGDLSTTHGIITIEPDEKGVIKIDTVRSLYDHARVKHAGKLVIIVDDAETMQTPAQNALLKLLEETPVSVFFILTTHHVQLLLPTIRSRAQEVDVIEVSAKTSREIITHAGGIDKATEAQLLFLAEGRPAEIIRLVDDAEYLAARAQHMREARNFLSQSLYEKLVFIYKLSNDREAAIGLLQDAMQIIGVTLKKQPHSNLAGLLEKLLQTEQKLRNDGHIRTQLLNLAILTG